MYAGRFSNAFSVLVTIPIAHRQLSPELFGVWMMLSAMLSFFAFADLGVGNGVLNRITAARATGDVTEIRRALVGGYICTASVGLALLAVWGVWWLVADDPIAVAGRIASENRLAVLTALHMFVLLLAVNIPASLIQKVQLGAQQGYWIGMAQVVASLGTLVAVPTTLYLGGGLPMLVAASLGVLVVVNALSSILWLFQNGFLRGPHWAQVDASTIRGLLHTGAFFLAIQIASAFAFQSDAIVITQLLGQSEYGDFGAVQRLFVFASMLISAALVGLWPAFGDAVTRGDIAWLRDALKHALRMAFLVMGVLCVALALSMPWIAKLWLGTTTPPSLLLTSLLSLWAMIESLGMVAGTFLNAAGILRAQVVPAVAMAIASFAGKWVLVAEIGVAGGVLATICAYCAISVPAQVFLLRRFFRSAERTSPMGVRKT
jgi:O-antigen/teichoic acid export membrane protein